MRWQLQSLSTITDRSPIYLGYPSKEKRIDPMHFQKRNRNLSNASIVKQEGGALSYLSIASAYPKQKTR
jgi:hypothetical protein